MRPCATEGGDRSGGRQRDAEDADGGGAAVTPSVAPGQDAETVFWQSVADSTNRADFEAYLKRWPEGVFARQARTRLAEQGHAPAQTRLGFMYAKGDGVEEDHAEAVRWFRLAAEQGLAPAQFNLGVMYEDGDGVEEDHVEAVRWYRLAAEQGHAPRSSTSA